HSHGLGGVELVGVGLKSPGVVAPGVVKVMGDELVGTTIFVYDAALPGKKFRDQMALKGFILGGETAVDGAADVGQIVPGAQSVAPIGQPKGGIESLYSAEFFLKPFLEQSLGAGGTGVVGLCLIVQLEA